MTFHGMPFFEVLGGILNIAQIVGSILRHVQGYRQVEEILKGSAAKTMRIESNIRRLDSIHTLNGVQSEILQDAQKDFKIIRDQLLEIQRKAINQYAEIKFLSSLE